MKSFLSQKVIRAFRCAPYLILALLIGCADRQITAANVDQTISEFQNGTLQMNGSLLTGGNGIFFLQKYEKLVNAQDWAGLSKLVIEVNSADNLGWFFLGFSAEKLGNRQAAIIYYQKSINATVQYCGPSTPNNDLVCGNLRWPDLAIRRLNYLLGQP